MSYALPGKTITGDPPLMTFWAADQLSQKAKLVAGTWPATGSAAASGQPLQVAVPKAAATELKLTAGQQLTVTSRITSKPIPITIAGIYVPFNITDRYWQLDPLAGAGVVHPQRAASGFITYGPFAMDADAFDRATAPVELSTIRARIVPDTTGIGEAGLQHFADALNATVASLKNDTRLGTAVQASIAAPTQVTALRHALAVVASSALIPTVLLAVLALCALVMSASLLAQTRVLTTALMRARGVGAPTIALQACLEALLFTVPTAVAAPFIAGFAVPHLFSGASTTGSSTAVWITSVVTAALCTAVLVATALRGTSGRGTYAEAHRVRSRRARGVALRRAVLELGLLALGLLGYSQLRRYGAGGSGSTDTGVNLVLVTAPAFALAAAALISVRIVPLVGRLAQVAAGRGKRFAFELGAWRAGRGGRIGAPALLLVVGVAMAVLSTSYSASWRRAQADQGSFTVGSDARAAGYAGSGILVSGVGDRLPGGDSAMLAGRDTATVGSSDTTTTILAVQPDKLASTMDLRPDLYPGGAAKLAADLAQQPRPAALALPGKPTGLVLRVKAALPGFQAVTQDGPYSIAAPTASITVSLTGRLGIGADASATLPLDNQEHDITMPFDFAGPTGADAGPGPTTDTPAWPLSLRGMRVDIAAYVPPTNDQAQRVQADVNVLSVRPVGADGTPGVALPPPAAGTWQTRSTSGDVDSQAAADSAGGAFLHATTNFAGYMQVSQTLAVGYGKTPQVLTPAEVQSQAPVPVIASAAYLAATGQHVGDTVKIKETTQTVQARIAGQISDVPTVPHGTPALLVDFGHWNTEVEVATGGPLPGSSLEWWVKTTPGTSGATVATLRSAERPASVITAASAVSALTSDPAQNGVRSAYLLAAAAAGAFALIDFLVHLAGAQRELSTQNALVRASGATRRQVGVAASVELMFLVGVGVVAGCGIGELLAHLLVPAVIVTGDGSPPAPTVLVSDPWLPMALLAVAGAAALGLAWPRSCRPAGGPPSVPCCASGRTDDERDRSPRRRGPAHRAAADLTVGGGDAGGPVRGPGVSGRPSGLRAAWRPGRVSRANCGSASPRRRRRIRTPPGR